MADLDEWLKLAPKPAERAAGQKWHVFLSYRSVERAWVLSLYDTLTQLGYETFLDQFVRDTASRVPRALEENLDASQAVIMSWSPRSEYSEWCKRAYDGFVTKETGAFRFDIARLGSVELPLWARSKLWVDFGDDREDRAERVCCGCCTGFRADRYRTRQSGTRSTSTSRRAAPLRVYGWRP